MNHTWVSIFYCTSAGQIGNGFQPLYFLDLYFQFQMFFVCLFVCSFCRKQAHCQTVQEGAARGVHFLSLHSSRVWDLKRSITQRTFLS